MKKELYSLKVETDRGLIELLFSDMDLFAKVVGFQVGILFGMIDDVEEFCRLHSKDLTNRWAERQKLGLFNLPATSNILDIGSGVGLLDLVLVKYLNDKSHFYLVDHDHTIDTRKHIHWGNDHGFYNDWRVFEDLVACSGIDRRQFTLLSPQEKWPEDLDLIMSSHSYLWHYPMETYWDRVYPHAKQGCRLAFDIINLKDVDVVAEITTQLGYAPRVLERPFPHFHWFSHELTNRNGSHGKVCVWGRED